MTRISRPIAIAACTFALAACATSTRPLAPARANDVPVARINETRFLEADGERNVPVTLLREAGYVGNRMGTVAVCDGLPLALLLEGEKVTVYLTPGPHLFAIGYAKHLETRPLMQTMIDVPAGGAPTVAMRMRLGKEPVFLVNGEVREDYSPAASPADSRLPTWSDLGNLEAYADPASVADIVDDAIAAATRRDWWRGNVGRNIDDTQRYIYTRREGWIDLKHVISTASNPGAYVPGLSWLASFGVEVAQVFVAPMSAFLHEDKISNSIGASAAMRHISTLRRGKSRGELAEEKIARFEPLTREQALTFFGQSSRVAR